MTRDEAYEAVRSVGVALECVQRGEIPAKIASTGGGDARLELWRFSDGAEVITTNADPIWSRDPEFPEALAALDE